MVITMDKVKIALSQANGLPGTGQNYGGGDGGGACFGGAIYNDENTELILLAGVEFLHACTVFLDMAEAAEH